MQVLLYAQKDEVEPDAIKQLVHLAESALPVKLLPSTSFACCQLHQPGSTVVLLQSGYVSAMPDVHLGKGVTVNKTSIHCCSGSCQDSHSNWTYHIHLLSGAYILSLYPSHSVFDIFCMPCRLEQCLLAKTTSVPMLSAWT